MNMSCKNKQSNSYIVKSKAASIHEDENRWKLLLEVNETAIDLYEDGLLDLSMDCLEAFLKSVRNCEADEFSFNENLNSISSRLQEGNNQRKVCTNHNRFDLYSEYPRNFRASISRPKRICNHWKKYSSKEKFYVFSSTATFNIGVLLLEKELLPDSHAKLMKLRSLILNRNSKDSVLVPSVANNIGVILLKQAEYSSALHYFKEGYSIAQVMLKMKNIIIFDKTELNECIGKILVNMGRAQLLMGNYYEAARKCCEAVAIRREYLEDDHPEICEVMFNLGFIHQKLNKHDEAMSFYRFFLDHTNFDTECNTPFIISALEKVIIYQMKTGALGTNDFTITNDLRKLSFLRETKGFDFLDLAPLLNRIAKKLRSANLIHFALPFFLEHLRLEKIFVGTKSLLLIDILLQIGEAFLDEELYLQALPYYHEILDIKETHKAKEDNTNVIALLSIGEILVHCEEWMKAKDFFFKAINTQKNIQGIFHKSTSVMLQNIGSTFLDIGMIIEAQKVLMEALLIWRFLNGNDHKSTAKALDKIGQIHDLLGEYEQALVAFYELLSIKKKNKEFNKEDIAVTLQTIGQIHHALGELEEASDIYKQLVSVLKKIVGNENGIVASTLETLGIIYLEKGDNKLAKNVLGQSKRIFKKISHSVQNERQQFKNKDIERQFRNGTNTSNIAAAAA